MPFVLYSFRAELLLNRDMALISDGILLDASAERTEIFQQALSTGVIRNWTKYESMASFTFYPGDGVRNLETCLQDKKSYIEEERNGS